MRWGLILAMICAAGACKGSGDAKTDGGVTATPAATSSVASVPSSPPHLVRDKDGRLVPTRPRPDDDPALMPPTPGGDPGGPVAAPVEADAPPAKLKDALFAAKLTPVRTQLYGRGSYVVITLAGWRPPLTPSAAPASMSELVRATCAASDGLPFGLF